MTDIIDTREDDEGFNNPTLVGGEGNYAISGLDGNDDLNGRGGSDTL